MSLQDILKISVLYVKISFFPLSGGRKKAVLLFWGECFFKRYKTHARVGHKKAPKDHATVPIYPIYIFKKNSTNTL